MFSKLASTFPMRSGKCISTEEFRMTKPEFDSQRYIFDFKTPSFKPTAGFESQGR